MSDRESFLAATSENSFPSEGPFPTLGRTWETGEFGVLRSVEGSRGQLWFWTVVCIVDEDKRDSDVGVSSVLIPPSPAISAGN